MDSSVDLIDAIDASIDQRIAEKSVIEAKLLSYEERLVATAFSEINQLHLSDKEREKLQNQARDYAKATVAKLCDEQKELLAEIIAEQCSKSVSAEDIKMDVVIPFMDSIMASAESGVRQAFASIGKKKHTIYA